MPWDDPSAPVPPIGRDASREISDQGGKLYASACARCHGTDGRGGGPEASELSTSVRDLTAPEEFVARSSVQGTVPFDADIYRTLRRGLPGTAMPSYRNLAPDGLWDLVAFVKTLSPHYGDPARAPKEAYAPAGAPADLRSLLAEGKALYLDLDCARCHGEDGKGNPAAGLVDSRGKPFATTDFVSGGGRFLCGMSPRDVARTFLIGMPGTPMESYLESLYGIGCDPRVMPAESRAAGDRKLWALVAYTIKLVEEAK
ncbi:MAG: c-type cytochrome [Planctomycetota bacterium]|nr:c-type cytochrome [Planctomycetota bacterium]